MGLKVIDLSQKPPGKRGRRSRPIADRFWDHVEIQPGDGCWLWTASTRRGGYGCFYVDHDRAYQSHRVAWTLAYGPIPNGLKVLHHCDVPLCCKPRHLFVGTDVANMQDMVQKGRKAVARGTDNALSKLQPVDVMDIFYSTESSAVLGERYGVTSAAIRHVWSHKRWGHLTDGLVRR